DPAFERRDARLRSLERTRQARDLLVLLMKLVTELRPDGGAHDEADRAARERADGRADPDADGFLLRRLAGGKRRSRRQAGRERDENELAFHGASSDFDRHGVAPSESITVRDRAGARARRWRGDDQFGRNLAARKVCAASGRGRGRALTFG